MTTGPGPNDVGATDGSGFATLLHLSVPWLVWVALAMLCVLPALFSVLTWSASHRRDGVDSSGRGGSA